MSAESTSGVHFFLSHKPEAASAAVALKETLEIYGGWAITVSGSGDAEPGTDWHDWLKSRLSESDVLVLLLTEPTAAWDWPLFELGLFTNLSGGRQNPVICLHHPDLAPPPPLQHVQIIAATQRAMVDFLKEVFGGTELTGLAKPINPNVASDPDRLASAAERLCSYFKPPIEHFRVTRSLTLVVTDPGRLDGRTLPADARVVADAHSLELFGLREREWTWAEFEASLLEQGDEQWTADVAKALFDATTHRLVRQPRTSFRSHRDQTPYRAVLGDCEAFPDGSWQFQLSLVEDVAEAERHLEAVPIFGQPIREGDWPEIFMLMPFEAEMEPVFRDHVAKVASNMGLNARRADDLFSKYSIAQDIWSAIHNARIVVADCTGRNANVFYEIGMAHSIGRDTILIARSLEDIPFDLRHLRVIEYEFTPRGMQKFETKLESALAALSRAPAVAADT